MFLTVQKQKIKQLKQNLKLEALLYQIPHEQIVEIAQDMKTIGVAYEARDLGGTDYRIVAKKLANKYRGRRRKLFDGLVQHKQFKTLIDNYVERVKDATDQPMEDASVAAE